MKNIKIELKQFLESLLNMEVSDDMDLLSSGLLNSLDIVSLLSNLEEKYDVSLTDSDFDLTNFKSINSIYKLLQRHLGE